MIRSISLPIAASAMFAATAVPAVAQQAGWRLADAQRAAWGRAGSTTIRLDNENVRFSGGQLVQSRAGPILLAEGKVGDFSHISPGRIGAFYLTPGPRGLRRAASYPAAVTMGSWGQMSEWGVSRRFGPNPVISAEGGFTGQGVTCVSTSLTELTPRGPVELARVPTGYEDPRGRSITGRITRVVPGRSFAIAYTGTMRFTDTYVRSGAKYRLLGRSRFPEC